MIPLRLRFLVGFLLLSVLFSSEAGARKVELWSYARLFKEATLVVIAKPIVSEAASDLIGAAPWSAEHFRAVNTRLKVTSIIRGNWNTKQDITVMHFQLKEGILLQDGPSFVSFRKTLPSMNIEVNRAKMHVALSDPEYLLFLKPVKSEGSNQQRFEPVSGRIDPSFSVREIYDTSGGWSALLGDDSLATSGQQK